MNKKFEYFLNAIHYGIFLLDVQFTKTIEKIVYGVLFFISKYFFPKRLKMKVYRRYLESQKVLQEFHYDKQTGLCAGSAHHSFGFFYSGYPACLAYIFGGIYIPFLGVSGDCIAIKFFLIMAIPIGIAYVPAYKAVFSNDRYLQYFKLFEKEDEQWHKKWKRRAIAFCIGGTIVSLVGIISAIAIAVAISKMQ